MRCSCPPPARRWLAHLGELVDAHERNVVTRIGAREKGELLRILAPFVRSR